MNTIKNLREMLRIFNPKIFKFERCTVEALLSEIENLEQSKNHFMNCCKKTSRQLSHNEKLLDERRAREINMRNEVESLHGAIRVFQETQNTILPPQTFINPVDGKECGGHALLAQIRTLVEQKNGLYFEKNKIAESAAELKQVNQRLHDQIDSHICTQSPRLFHNPYTGEISEPKHLVTTIESLMHLLKLSQSDHGTDKGKLRQIQSILDKAE